MAAPAQTSTLPYASPDTLVRWSPLPLITASGCLGTVLTMLCNIEFKLQQICQDFGFVLPLATRLSMRISGFVWHRSGWMILLPIAIAWPVLIIRTVQVQPTLEARRRRLRLVWRIFAIVGALAFATNVIGIVPAMLAMLR